MVSRSELHTRVSKTSAKAASSVDTAARKTKSVIRHTSSKLHEEIDLAAAKAHTLQSKIKGKVQSAEHSIKITAEKAKDKLVDEKKKTEAYVKQHPWKALGFAALAGFVVAKILRRRR